ncbi:P-loop containing nucleoside triphosphate hydrolase protein [Trametes polyzona]|nr:P-loop containing nucleoside triphosphate hydrolase protein [Trametes polyzona]
MANGPDVFVRLRPLPPSVPSTENISWNAAPASDANSDDERRYSLTLSGLTGRTKEWKGGPCFAGIYDPTTSNEEVYNRTVSGPLADVLKTGGAATFFAYGHTGSGKTHTIFGQGDVEGISILAAQTMFQRLESYNKDRDDASRLGIGIKLFELRSGSAFDLLNDKNECFIREGPDGRTHIRGKTEKLEDNKVRVRPIETIGCWSWEEAKQVLVDGLRLRSVGTSTIHDQSSRTHAVLQLEIITAELLKAREEIWDREAELVPVGKHATDVYIEEHMKALTKDDDGNYKPNPDHPLNQARIDEAEAVKAEYEARVAEAVQRVEAILNNTPPGAPAKIGGRVVFVDLAGAEFNDNSVSGNPRTNQSASDKKATRQINTDLMTLKEVVRAHATRQARIPFRGSPLTMVLREHFTGEAHASMIVTVSTEREQSAATLNSLRFASTAAA